MKKHKMVMCGLLETKLTSSRVACMYRLQLKHWQYLTNADAASTVRIVINTMVRLFLHMKSLTFKNVVSILASKRLTHVHFGPPGAFTNHSHVEVCLDPYVQGRKNFKYFNMWASHDQILEVSLLIGSLLRKTKKHIQSTSKGKEVIIVEAVKSQNPVTLACAGVVVSPVYADMVVASECAGDVLEVAPGLEPPNPGEVVASTAPIVVFWNPFTVSGDLLASSAQALHLSVHNSSGSNSTKNGKSGNVPPKPPSTKSSRGYMTQSKGFLPLALHDTGLGISTVCFLWFCKWFSRIQCCGFWFVDLGTILHVQRHGVLGLFALSCYSLLVIVLGLLVAVWSLRFGMPGLCCYSFTALMSLGFCFARFWEVLEATSANPWSASFMVETRMSFSSFPRGACLPSVSRPYLALEGIYRADWGCIPKQSNSQTVPHGAVGSNRDGALTLSGAPFQGLWHGLPLTTLL
ncbi:hypothetical protein Peur_004636 [Populus x canadensis]